MALLGILLMNIPSFALPQYFEEAFNTNPHSGNYWLLLVTTVAVARAHLRRAAADAASGVIVSAW